MSSEGDGSGGNGDDDDDDEMGARTLSLKVHNQFVLCTHCRESVESGVNEVFWVVADVISSSSLNN